MIDNYELHQGDCLELMKNIPDASVDMILCDLPYGTTACKWDAVIPFDDLWEQYRRVLNADAAVVLTAAQPFTTVLIASNFEWFKYCWVWQKTKPGGFMNAKNAPLKITEDVCVFSPGTTANKSQKRMRYNPQGIVPARIQNTNNSRKQDSTIGGRPSRTGNSYIQEFSGYPNNILKFASDGSHVHPTQKPVALMEYLIRTYTNEGEIVLDNCMGSGTTGVACANTGRRFIGIEKDEKYFEIATKRIQEAFSPPTTTAFPDFSNS